jgi:hypothetical protein
MAKDEEKSPRKKFIRRGSGELLDTRELALALNESPFTIRTWRKKRIVPYLRIGHRSIRYRLPAVLAALERFTIKTK